MKKQLCLLCALCLALTACGRRIQNNQPTGPVPAAATQVDSDSTLGSESDPLGDEVEQLLEQLDSANTDAGTEIEQLPAP